MNLEATRLRGRPRNRWQHELREEKTSWWEKVDGKVYNREE